MPAIIKDMEQVLNGLRMTFEWALNYAGRILGSSWALPGLILGYFVWMGL